MVANVLPNLKFRRLWLGARPIYPPEVTIPIHNPIGRAPHHKEVYRMVCHAAKE